MTEKVAAEVDNSKKTASNIIIEPMGEKSDKEKDDDKRSRTAQSDSVKEEVVDKEVLQVTSHIFLVEI